MGLEIRAVLPEEYEEMRRAMGLAFGFDPEPGDERFRHVLPLHRTRCAFEGDRIVATSGVFELEMTVPGGRVACAGTTIVSVAPTHRRQGILRQVMDAHLDDVTESGEPIAALWASDSAIYGRFGYGMASILYELEIDRAHVAFHRLAPEVAPVRYVEAAEAEDLLPAFYEGVVPTIPGLFTRWPEWWQQRRFADPASGRQGMTARRYAVVDGEDGIEGFVQYRAKLEWEEGHGAGKIVVNDLLGATPRAWAGLWGFVLNHDLVARIEADLRPEWDPVFDLLAGPRRAKATVGDGVWVRLMDIPAALGSRSYQTPLDLVLAVSDPLGRNTGRYRLRAEGTEVDCRATGAAPDLEMDLEDLGACYLGRARFRRLAAAGRVRGRPEALAAADRAFTSDPQPWCPEIF